MTQQLNSEHQDFERPDVERRFGGVKRLFGDTGLNKLQAAHIVVVGIGGVGSWTAEALARNAVGSITLVDLDNIAESNVNRQIHALDGNFGKAKITAMRERIFSINPDCVVREIEYFVTVENARKILDFHFDCLVDCIDDASAKAVLAVLCKAVKSPIVMSGSAGGRLDPTRIQVADLSVVTNDKLLAKVRNLLRRDYQFPKASSAKNSAKFGVNCVYSDESVIKPDKTCDADSTSITGLNCAGYGSSVCVTAPMGFAAAQLAINLVIA